MNEHEGYQELGLVGFSDKGDYDPGATYVKNDLVHLHNAIWKCLQDNTSGIEPAAENENWSIFVASENDLSGITAVDKHGILGEESAQVEAEELVNALAAPAYDDSGSDPEISGFQSFIDSVKTGTKIIDFFKNLKSGLKFVLHTGQLVNNGLCNEPGKYPLDAAYGKALYDLISKCQGDISTLNSASFQTITEFVNTEYFAPASNGYYYVLGKICIVNMHFTCTQSSSGNNIVVLDNLPMPANGAMDTYGATVSISSGINECPLIFKQRNSQRFGIRGGAAGGNYMGQVIYPIA